MKNFCVGITTLFLLGVFSIVRNLPIQAEQGVFTAVFDTEE